MSVAIRCEARRSGGQPCPGRLVERHDRITGRLAFVCPACERRKAGVCADCERPVEGTVGRAERCAMHAKQRVTLVGERSRERNADAIRSRKRDRERAMREKLRGGRPPMSLSERGKLGCAARAAALSPERRHEIAMLAARASVLARKQSTPLRSAA